MALDWISGSPKIDTIRLRSNALNASQTTQVLDAILSAKGLLEITSLVLVSTNFDDSCEKLAQVLDQATKLEYLDIYGQTSSNEVQAAVFAATDGANGWIKITDCSGNVVCQMDTARTTSVTVLDKQC